MTPPAGEGLRLLVTDLGRLPFVRRLVGLRAFQFLLVLPTTALVGVALCSAAVGVEHPSFNFGATFTWIVWWGALLASFVVLGRAWCLVCPIGAVGEWVQRLSLWRRVPYTAGYHFRWPRPLRGLGLATSLFVVFVWLDNGYGISNSPRMTAGLIVVLALGAAWVNLFFERRAFCRYVCPLTVFIGLCSLFSIFELRSRDSSRCGSACATKDCFRGNTRQYGCPMGEFPAVMDTNLHCILCTECIKGCPHDNLTMRFRAPGHDLWTMRRPERGGALAAAVVVGLATCLPLLLVALLPNLRRALAGVMPAGEAPRLAAMGFLFAVGIVGGVAVIWSFSALARLAAGLPGIATREVFTRAAYALVPIALFKMLADLVDHALRSSGALLDVARAMVLDFPLNRVVPGRVTVVPAPEVGIIYALQAGLLLCGLAASLYALRRICGRLYAGREAPRRAFVPLAGLALVLALMGLWTLGIVLL